MNDTFDRLTQLAVELTGAAGAVLTTGADPDRFVLSTHGRLIAAIRPGERFPFTPALGGAIADTGRPLVIEDVAADATWRDSAVVAALGLRAFAGLPLRDDAGAIVATLAVYDVAPRAWDATALRALDAIGAMAAREVDLRRQRDLAAFLMENAAEGAVIIDPAGALRYSSSISRSLFGYCPGELLGRSVLELVHPDDRAFAVGELARIAGTPGVSRSSEVRFRHREGQWRAVAVAATNRLDDPVVHGIVLYLRDITEQRAVEEALRTGAERFRALTEHAHDVTGIIAPDGTILYESPSIEAALGFRPEEVVGRHATEFIHPDDWAAIEDALGRVSSRQDKVIAVKYRVPHRDGTYRVFDAKAWNASHIPAVGGIVVNARDVTDEEALAAQLRQAQKIEAVGRLAGGVAHDFNNILTVITARTSFAREDLPVDSPVQGELAEIEAAAQRASRLTRQLLAFGRQQVLRPQTVDLNSVAADIARMLGRTLGEDIEVILDLAPEPVHTWADPTQLEQVLLNLAVNARDAMPEGGTLTLRTSRVDVTRAAASRHEGLKPATYAVLTVSDTGTGMDHATQGRIFEPFFTTKGPGKGTGLGLATVYGIVKQSGGYVRVESERGNGSTFTIMLPPDAGVPTGEHRVPIRTLARGQGTILLVEDDLAVRILVRRILERGGYGVVEARHGRDALELLEAGHVKFDLMLTDAVMPVMGARELIPKARAVRPGLKVVVMTGYSDDAVETDGRFDEGVDLIAKPFPADELLDRVGRGLTGIAGAA